MTLIQSGPARVISAGVVTTFMGFPLRFEVDVTGRPFAVELVFTTDLEQPDVAVTPEVLGPCLRLTCVNFNGADGRGSSRPVLLGDTDTAAVFFHFRVFLYGSTDDRTVHYTFFVADKQAIGFKPA